MKNYIQINDPSPLLVNLYFEGDGMNVEPTPPWVLRELDGKLDRLVCVAKPEFSQKFIDWLSQQLINNCHSWSEHYGESIVFQLYRRE